VGPRFDPHAVAERYARAARSPALGQAVDEVARLAEQLYTDNGWALCHHDPHAGNLLGFDAPVLIDWEYAANGQPLFDLAVVIRYHRLDAAAAEILLSAWAGDGGEAHRERLAGFCQLYDLLSVLWEQAIAAG
jgi:thiamine kinase-like enzyme